MRILLGQTKIALGVVVHLLHIKVSLGLISIIIKVLVDLLLSSRVIMADAQFLSLVAAIVWLVLELWVDADLVAQNGLVLPMLDADFLILASEISNLHRVLPHVRLRGNGAALLGLEEHGTLWIDMLTLHLAVVLLRNRVFQGLCHLRRILISFTMLHPTSRRL